MAITNFSQVLLAQINDKKIAEMVANALRQEHQNDSAVIKEIDKNIDVSPNIIYKWYRAEKPPKSAHLLKLAGAYPQVLKGVFEMIGREDIWELCLAENIPEKMCQEMGRKNVKCAVYRDKFVPINEMLTQNIAVKLNQREIWFLGELQKDRNLKAANIEEQWQVTNRTAKRDISNLLHHKLINFIGANKNGYYEIKY